MATGMEATNAITAATDSKTGIWPSPTDPAELNHSMDMGRLTTAINQVEQGLDK